MKLHAIVDDFQAAVIAVEGGATVVQLRLKGAPTEQVVEAGRPFRGLPIVFVVNDDVDAALELRADGVHLGRTDPGAERALEHGLMLGTSASSVEEAVAGEQLGAAYVGAGPIWPTPTKPDADAPIGLDGLREISEAVSVPVIAIGGIDVSNAVQCIAAGASGVAVVRAASDLRALSEALGAR
ncbi:MAG TPA: thiamine phosphate synthase [Gaiellaceae bacterium]|jgi:thiamine-phosphate pyrophosphorylase